MPLNFSQKRRHIAIIGGGPQGLATGIELLKAGHKVTILEANEKVGQGVSHRPEHSQWGIGHTVAYDDPATERVRMTRKLNELVQNPPPDDVALKAYIDNSDPIGKLIVARNDDGLKNLNTFANNLREAGTRFSMLTSQADFVALNESTLGDLSNIKAIIDIPDVRVIHIKNYIRDLQRIFEENGGKILLSHEVAEFVVPTCYKRGGTSVVCNTPSGQVIVNADAVINMAGLYATDMAQKAAEALRKSKDDGHGAIASPPVSPTPLYSLCGVLVREESAPPLEGFRHVIYVADNARIGRKRSIRGAHSYVSGEKDTDQRWPFTIGPLVTDVSKEDLKTGR